MRRFCSYLSGFLAGRASEHGQTLVLWIFSLAAIVAMMAVAIDIGVGFGEKSKAQRAADSAAYGAALEHLLAGGSDSEVEAAAYEWAAANGYDNADPDTSVVVNIPPESGPHAGDSFFVEVIIQDTAGTQFAQVAGREVWDIVSRAVATSDTTPKPYSIITLDPNVCKALNVDGSVLIDITDAGTFTQSNCATDAFHTQGKIVVDSADNDVVGGWQTGGSVTPAPTKAYPIIDPLGELDPPTAPTEPVHPCPTFSGPTSTLTLEPGVYECQIDPPGAWALNFLEGNYHLKGGIKMDGGGATTFGAGEYTIGGSGLVLTGNGSVVADEAVFYIEEGALKLTGTGDMQFDAPSSGDYEGVAFFQARDNTNTVFITGNAAQDGWGTVYAKAAQIDFSGNGTTNFQFIGDTFYAHGNSTANIVFQDNFLADVPFIWLAE